MKAKRTMKRIFTRMTFILAFLALCATVICFSLGIIRLPSIELPWDVDPSYSKAESTEKEPQSGEYVPGSSSRHPDPRTDSPDVSSDPGTTDPGTAVTTNGGDGPAVPLPDTPLLRDLLSKGYGITWDSWYGGMTLARVFADGFLPSDFTGGNTMQERGVSSVSYQSAGIEFNSFVTKSSQRPYVDLYMGYIIIDSGVGTGTDIIAGTSETKNSDGSVTVHRTDRAKQTKVKTLTIYNSQGRAIGTYIASKVIPANTRDRENRPLFWYGNNYYYIDEQSGDFILSDYIDERDSRGLYFDYNPDYGTPDSDVLRYDIFTDVTQNFTINSYYVYTRNQIDVRLARQLYIDFPSYAQTVANHNATFKHFYTLAKAEVDEERKHTTAVSTTAAPEPITTAVPPITTSGVPTGVTETSSAPFTTGTPAVDTVPETGTSQPETPGTGVQSASQPDNTGASVSEAAFMAASPETAGLSSDVTVSPASPESTPPEGTGQLTDTPGSSATDSPEYSSAPEESLTDVPTEASTEPETTQKDYTLNVSITYPAYRFGYGKAQPKADLGYVTTMKYTVAPYVGQSGSWATAYKYAQAYSFREGRALTVDDNGVVRIINTAGSSVIYDNSYVKPEYYSGGQLHRYYILPSARDAGMLGHFYFDHGLIRLVRAQTNYLATNAYYSLEDMLLDTSGKVYAIPSGFNLVSYSEGILLLEKNGVYGCYHKDGYWIADPIYTSAQPFIEGLCVLGLRDGTYGAIDTSGKVVLPFAYKSITNASSGLVACFSEAYGWQVFAKMTK